MGGHPRAAGRVHFSAAEDAARLRHTPEGGGGAWSVPADLASGAHLPVAAAAPEPGVGLDPGNQRQPSARVGSADAPGSGGTPARLRRRCLFRTVPLCLTCLTCLGAAETCAQGAIFRIP